MCVKHLPEMVGVFLMCERIFKETPPSCKSHSNMIHYKQMFAQGEKEMSLQFIIGGAGSGKSYTMYQRIIEASIKNPDAIYYVIVPEQATLLVEQEIIRLHPRKGLLNIEVLSFVRLAYHVFSEIGSELLPMLDDTGKVLILRRVAEEKKENLTLLKGQLKKNGCIQEVKSLLSEWMQYGIGGEQLSAMEQASEDKPLLHTKLKDMSELYHGFREFIESRYITPEEMLSVLSRVINQSEKVRKAYIAFDGFTGFTPVQNVVVRELLSCSRGITVTITVGQGQNPYQLYGEQELFHMGKTTIRQLSMMAEECGVQRADDILLQGRGVRYQDKSELSHLEQNLFRYPNQVYQAPCQQISIMEAANPHEELLFAASKIRECVEKKGYRYRDIAVISGDMESYGREAKKVFALFDIPCFIDTKRSLFQNPCVEFLRAFLQVFVQNFSYESVFRMLRSNMTPLKRQNVDILENYVLSHGVRGRTRWSRQWVRDRYRESDDSEYAVEKRNQLAEEIQQINELRQQVVALTASFAKAVKGKCTVRKITEALFSVCRELNIQRQLEVYVKQFEEAEDFAGKNEYGQIYKKVLELFDKLVELLGEETITLREYAEILDAGFSEIKIGILPTGIDRVVFGDLERTRLEQIKMVIVVGTNDGLIPSHSGNGGLLSDLDREFLSSKEFHLAPTARQKGYMGRFYLYLLFSKPSEGLVLSYSRNSSDGASLRPSYCIGTLCKLFPELQVMKYQTGKNAYTPKHGVEVLLRDLPYLTKSESVDPAIYNLIAWYEQNDDWKLFVDKMLKAVFYQKQEEGLTPDTAQLLYGKELINSVSRLEQFAACAFAHFLTYGLQLKERAVFEFAPVDMGNLFHEALELFGNQMKEEGLTWQTIENERREQLVEEVLEKCVASSGSMTLGDTARSSYTLDRMKRILKRTTWALCQQLKRGAFYPACYEERFFQEYQLEAKRLLKLYGIIDRIDICKDTGKVYVKIVDYKSGMKKFEITEFYHGLQMQLPMYLDAAMQKMKEEYAEDEVIPAGILYYHMDDPLIDTLSQSGEEIEAEILAKLRAEGLVNEDGDIIEQLDQSGDAKSLVIPVGRKKDGSLTATSSTANTEQFHMLCQYGEQKSEELARRILNGEAESEPYSLDGKTACDYCGYRGICGFDKRIEGYHYQKYTKEKPEEVWKKIEQAVKKEGEHGQ